MTVFFGKVAFAQRFLALAGQHQDRLAADRIGGLQVAHAVADTRHARQVHAEALADLDEHPGLGFAAIARRVGGMRAIEHGVDASAGVGQRLVHLFVDGDQRRHVEQAAPSPD